MLRRVEYQYEGPRGHIAIMYSPDLQQQVEYIFLECSAENGEQGYGWTDEEAKAVFSRLSSPPGLLGRPPITTLVENTVISSARAHAQTCGGCGKSGTRTLIETPPLKS